MGDPMGEPDPADTLEAGLVGRDAATLERFYVDAMGFRVTDRLHFDEFGTVVRLVRAAAHLKLYFPAGPLDPPRRDDPWYRAGGWRYAALVLSDLGAVDDLARRCAAAGGEVLIEPRQHRPGARMALVTDPEGNPWELLASEPDAALRRSDPEDRS